MTHENSLRLDARLTPLRAVGPWGLVFALSLAACGKKESPAADVAPADTEKASPTPDTASSSPAVAPIADTIEKKDAPDCAAADVMQALGGLEPDFARIEGHAVELCGDASGKRLCISLDLETGKRTVIEVSDTDFDRIAPYPAGFDDGLVRDDKKPVIKLCLSAEAGCKDLHTGNAIAGHFDKDRSRVVLTSWDEGMKRATVYDTKSLEATQTLDIAPGDLPDCTFADFAGESLLISTGECAGNGKSWLADPKTGQKIADIGADSPLFVKSGEFAHLHDTTWVFRSATGDRAVYQDVMSGKVAATVDLNALSENALPKDDIAWVLSKDGAAIFVESRPASGTIRMVDRDGKALKSHVPKACAP
jgi:hypothetical protein